MHILHSIDFKDYGIEYLDVLQKEMNAALSILRTGKEQFKHSYELSTNSQPC